MSGVLYQIRRSKIKSYGTGGLKFCPEYDIDFALPASPGALQLSSTALVEAFINLKGVPCEYSIP